LFTQYFGVLKDFRPSLRDIFSVIIYIILCNCEFIINTLMFNCQFFLVMFINDDSLSVLYYSSSFSNKWHFSFNYYIHSCPQAELACVDKKYNLWLNKYNFVKLKIIWIKRNNSVMLFTLWWEVTLSALMDRMQQSLEIGGAYNYLEHCILGHKTSWHKISKVRTTNFI
jgi:hypothetical protein